MNAPTLALAFGLSACATRTPPEALDPAGLTEQTDATDPSRATDDPLTREDHDAVMAEVRASLSRLGELELLAVGALIVEAPEGAQNCYGPCADDPEAQAWMQEHARQADRLAALVERAEQVAAEPAASLDSDAAAIEALQGLAIVEIHGVHYEGTGNCYVGQCPGDDEKRGRVQALAEAAQDL